MPRPKAEQRAGKRPRRILIALVLLAVSVVFFPAIIAKTELRNWLFTGLLPGGTLTITTGGASLGWTNSPAIYDVRIDDAAGQPLLTASSITIDRTPLQLFNDRQSLGIITIQEVKLYLRVRPDGSNLEDVLAGLARDQDVDEIARQEQSAKSRKRLPNVTVRIEGGQVLQEATDGSRPWRAESIHAELKSGSTAEHSVRLEISGRVVPTDLPPGGVEQGLPAGRRPGLAAGSFSLLLKPTGGDRQQLDLQTGAVSLEALAPWLQRLVNRPQLTGFLTADAYAVWSTAAGEVDRGLPYDFTSAGHVAIEELDFFATELAGDHVRVQRADAPWQIQSQGSSLLINELAIRTEIGELEVQGAVDLLALKSATPASAIRRQDLRLDGNLDLAKIAAMLPNALKIRQGTSISEGALRLNVHCRPEQSGQRLSGKVETTNLSAVNRGQLLHWDQPLQIDFDTVLQDEQFHIDRLECDSSFGRVIAEGDDRELRASAEFDLTRLAAELGQFVDLSDWQPAGTGAAQLVWRKGPQNRFHIDTRLNLDRFSLRTNGHTAWSEPQLTITTEAAGLLDQQRERPLIVESATVQLRAAGDTLDAELREAVNLQVAGSSWPIAMRASGGVAQWLARLRPWLDSDWESDGNLDLAVDLRASRELVELQNTKVTVTDLRATGPGWTIDEPRIEFTGDMRWSGQLRELASQDAQLVSSSVAFSTREVRIALPTHDPPKASGTLAMRADLARLSAMRIAPDNGPVHRLAGMVVGNVRFQAIPNAVEADLDVQGDRLTLSRLPAGNSGQAGSDQVIWQEPQFRVRGHAHYQVQSDQLVLDQLEVESQTLAATTSGSINRVTTQRDVQLRGSIDYDLAELSSLLTPFVGDEVQLTGKKKAIFDVVGSLARSSVAGRGPGVLTSAGSTPVNAHWSRTLKARLQAPWDGAEIYGLSLGPGQISADLVDGAIRFEPLVFSVGGGQLHSSPLVRLDPPPGELTLPREQVLTNVRISREVSDAMLKYIAPVLADATRSEGLFSLQLERGRVPLREPKQADIAGQLTIHTVNVVPGPATEQWVRLAQQIESLVKDRDPQALVARPPKTLLAIQERSVPFRLVQGRVYHEGMEFYLGEVIVRSQGSVGLDETMQLTLDVPILDKWVADTPLLAGLRGKVIQIPVGGTLSRPQIDARAVTSLSTQLLQGMAQEALGGELNKALNKLFGR